MVHPLNTGIFNSLFFIAHLILYKKQNSKLQIEKFILLRNLEITNIENTIIWVAVKVVEKHGKKINYRCF